MRVVWKSNKTSESDFVPRCQKKSSLKSYFSSFFTNTQARASHSATLHKFLQLSFIQCTGSQAQKISREVGRCVIIMNLHQKPAVPFCTPVVYMKRCEIAERRTPGLSDRKTGDKTQRSGSRCVMQTFEKTQIWRTSKVVSCAVFRNIIQFDIVNRS